MSAVTSNKLGVAVLTALGIDPKLVHSFKLICEAGTVARVEMTQYVERSNAEPGAELGVVLSQYRLVLAETEDQVEPREDIRVLGKDIIGFKAPQ